MWAVLLKLLGGPLVSNLVNGAISAYKAKLAAGTSAETIAVDLAKQDLDLQARERDINAREQAALAGMPNGWLSMGPMWLISWAVGLYCFWAIAVDKIVAPVVYYANGCIANSAKLCPALDKLFSIDPLSASLSSIALSVVAYYFGRALIGAGTSIATVIAGALARKT